MDIQEMVNTLKGHPDSTKIGMIATHLGVVRGTSRGGEGVTGVEVELVWEPFWTPERIDPKVRSFLGH